MDIFPGSTTIARNESRHVLFGVRFLHDMIQQDRHYADIVIGTIRQHLPTIHETLYKLRERRVAR